MQQFMITKNQYLKKDTIGYYHQYYTGYGNPDNPNFLNILKNQFNSESVIIWMQQHVRNPIQYDLPQLLGITIYINGCLLRTKKANNQDLFHNY